MNLGERTNNKINSIATLEYYLAPTQCGLIVPIQRTIMSQPLLSPNYHGETKNPLTCNTKERISTRHLVGGVDVVKFYRGEPPSTHSTRSASVEGNLYSQCPEFQNQYFPTDVTLHNVF